MRLAADSQLSLESLPSVTIVPSVESKATHNFPDIGTHERGRETSASPPTGSRATISPTIVYDISCPFDRASLTLSSPTEMSETKWGRGGRRVRS